MVMYLLMHYFITSVVSILSFSADNRVTYKHAMLWLDGHHNNGNDNTATLRAHQWFVSIAIPGLFVCHAWPP